MKTKIAIQIDNGYKAVEADLFEIEGIAAAVHRSPGKNGFCFAVSCPVTGLAFAKAATRKGAVELATERIIRAGAWQVQAKLNAANRAPSVQGLEVWQAPVRESAPKADVNGIVELVSKTVGGLNDAEKKAVARALNSRTGQLKAKSPSAFGDAEERLAAAAWQGLQPNGYKIGIVSVFSLRGEARDLYDRLSKVKWPAAFDKDKLALVNAGVW